MDFDEAATAIMPVRRVGNSRGRPFVADLVMMGLRESGRDSDADKLLAALRDPDRFPGRKLSRICTAMGAPCSYGAIENWRDRYTPGWRKSERGLL